MEKSTENKEKILKNVFQMPLDCMLKMGDFMLHEFYPNKKYSEWKKGKYKHG